MTDILAEYLKIHDALAADNSKGVTEASTQILLHAKKLKLNEAPKNFRNHLKNTPVQILEASEKLSKTSGLKAQREVFKALLLDSQNRIIDIVEITEGTVNQANPIIRKVFQRAFQDFAASIICVHNHPSGKAKPSNEDRRFTMDLVQAGKVLQIQVLDHIIIGDNEYYSFSEEEEIF